MTSELNPASGPQKSLTFEFVAAGTKLECIDEYAQGHTIHVTKGSVYIVAEDKPKYEAYIKVIGNQLVKTDLWASRFTRVPAPQPESVESEGGEPIKFDAPFHLLVELPEVGDFVTPSRPCYYPGMNFGTGYEVSEVVNAAPVFVDDNGHRREPKWPHRDLRLVKRGSYEKLNPRQRSDAEIAVDLVRELAQQKSANAALLQDLKAATAEASGLQRMVVQLQGQLDALNQENETITRRFQIVSLERDGAQSEVRRYWSQICDTMEALGKLVPETAPHSVGWAKKIKAESVALQAEVTDLKATKQEFLDKIFNIYQIAGWLDGGDEVEAVRRLRADRDAAHAQLAAERGKVERLREAIAFCLDNVACRRAGLLYAPFTYLWQDKWDEFESKAKAALAEPAQPTPKAKEKCYLCGGTRVIVNRTFLPAGNRWMEVRTACHICQPTPAPSAGETVCGLRFVPLAIAGHVQQPRRLYLELTDTTRRQIEAMSAGEKVEQTNSVESVPVNPIVAAKVRSILKERGFKGYESEPATPADANTEPTNKGAE